MEWVGTKEKECLYKLLVYNAHQQVIISYEFSYYDGMKLTPSIAATSLIFGKASLLKKVTVFANINVAVTIY